MMGSLRKEVLQCFKKLHKTSLYIFNEDQNALHMARIKINEEFKKNKAISDEKKIQELLKIGHEVEHELRTTVIQAVEVKPGSYEARIRPETLKLDNIPFNDNAITEGCPGKSV